MQKCLLKSYCYEMLTPVYKIFKNILFFFKIAKNIFMVKNGVNVIFFLQGLFIKSLQKRENICNFERKNKKQCILKFGKIV